eukprot:4837270-Amphidinium_carterae.1
MLILGTGRTLEMCPHLCTRTIFRQGVCCDSSSPRSGLARGLAGNKTLTSLDLAGAPCCMSCGCASGETH